MHRPVMHPEEEIPDDSSPEEQDDSVDQEGSSLEEMEPVRAITPVD